MGVEIERKFLVRSQDFREEAEEAIQMVQGYLSTTPEHTIRVRRTGEEARLTIKGPARGLVRPEFEVEITAVMAGQLLAHFCQGRTLTKTRYVVPRGGGWCGRWMCLTERTRGWWWPRWS